MTKPGGHVLLSVMSLLGAARAFFDQLPPLVDEFGWKRAVTDIFERETSTARSTRATSAACIAGAV